MDYQGKKTIVVLALVLVLFAVVGLLFNEFKKKPANKEEPTTTFVKENEVVEPVDEKKKPQEKL